MQLCCAGQRCGVFGLHIRLGCIGVSVLEKGKRLLRPVVDDPIEEIKEGIGESYLFISKRGSSPLRRSI